MDSQLILDTFMLIVTVALLVCMLMIFRKIYIYQKGM